MAPSIADIRKRAGGLGARRSVMAEPNPDALPRSQPELAMGQRTAVWGSPEQHRQWGMPEDDNAPGVAFAATGADIAWAVVDSGIDDQHPHFKYSRYNNLHHPDVEELHRDFTVPGDPGPETRATALTDHFGHGTHVAGIIAGGL